MTDIRCPECDAAFFDHVTSYSAPPDSHDAYDCQQCGHTILVTLRAGTDPETIRPNETRTALSCLHCGNTHFDDLGVVTSLEGDSDHAYTCSNCESSAYCIRLDTPETATSPKYDGPNPFANSN